MIPVLYNDTRVLFLLSGGSDGARQVVLLALLQFILVLLPVPLETNNNKQGFTTLPYNTPRITTITERL